MKRALLLVAPLALIAAIYGLAQIPTAVSGIGSKAFTSVLGPLADSITALQITKADGTTRVIDIDTTNARVGIGTSAPAADLDVLGNVYVHGSSKSLFIDQLSGYTANSVQFGNNTGTFSFQFGGTTSAFPEIKRAASSTTLAFRLADDSGDAPITAKSVQVSVLTVSTLPTCNGAAEGTIYAVSDATAPTYNATLTGSSTVHTLAVCNGTNWVAH